jgi:predicted enzyme related to lactoylglutathione lyase
MSTTSESSSPEPSVGLLVNIDVDDLARGVAFYSDAFGLRVGRRFGPHGAEMLGASSAIYLLSKPAGSTPVEGTSQARAYDRHWTPIHLDFVVHDLEAAIARAERAGARVESAIRAHAWGRIAMLSDPFGHGLCLLELTERGYDAIADG